MRRTITLGDGVIGTIAAALARRHRSAGCIICGEETLPSRHTDGDHGLHQVSKLLSIAKSDEDDTSPLCCKHWHEYIIHRRVYHNDAKYSRILSWLLAKLHPRLIYQKGGYKTLSLNVFIKKYGDKHFATGEWRGDLQFYSLSDVLDFTIDDELRKAIFKFFGFGFKSLEEMLLYERKSIDSNFSRKNKKYGGALRLIPKNEQQRKGPYRDLTGQRFGHLIVIREIENNRLDYMKGRVTWICKCDCGKERNVSTDQLKGGESLTCGDRGHRKPHSRLPDRGNGGFLPTSEEVITLIHEFRDKNFTHKRTSEELAKRGFIYTANSICRLAKKYPRSTQKDSNVAEPRR
jgi:hypothetical protein